MSGILKRTVLMEKDYRPGAPNKQTPVIRPTNWALVTTSQGTAAEPFFWPQFWNADNYDPADEAVMVNEIQYINRGELKKLLGGVHGGYPAPREGR